MVKIKISQREIDSIVNMSLGRGLKFYFDIEGRWYFALLFPVYCSILFIMSLIAYPILLAKICLLKQKDIENG